MKETPGEKGFLIAFEGIDGCGKSTQAKLLSQRLEEKGVEHLLVREPGTTQVAESVREILLHAVEKPLDPETELLLYLAARADLYRRLLLPRLRERFVVLSDRCFWSSVAYQGAGLGIGTEKTRELCLFAVAGREPDLVIVFDLPLAEALGRRKGPADRIEGRSRKYIERVREAFLEQARAAGEKALVLDGTEKIETLHEIVLGHVQKLLGREL